MLIQTYWYLIIWSVNPMQKVKTQSSKLQASRSFDPKVEFIDTCLSKGVPFTYSQLFLQSLQFKQFSNSQEEIKIKAYAIAEEIGLINRGESISQELQQIITERVGIVRELRNQLTNSVQSRQLNLASVCLKIENIRIYSLMVIQKIQVLVQKLKIFRCPYYTETVQKISEDMDFLKYGPLKKYMEFSRTSDPLLMVPLRKFNFTQGNPKKPLVNLFQIESDLLKRLEKAQTTLKMVNNSSDQSQTDIAVEAARSKHISSEQDRQIKLRKLVKKLKGPERQELQQIIDGKKKRGVSREAKQSRVLNKQMNEALQPSPIRYKAERNNEERTYRQQKDPNSSKLPLLLSNNMRANLKSMNKSIQANSRLQNRQKRYNSIDSKVEKSQINLRKSLRSSIDRNSQGEGNEMTERKNDVLKRKQSFRRSVSRSPNQEREARDKKLIRQFINEQNKLKTIRNTGSPYDGTPQYINKQKISSNRPYLQKLQEREDLYEYEEKSSNRKNTIFKSNFRSINPNIERQDGILSLMPAHPNYKIPIRIVRQKQINYIEAEQVKKIMQEDVSEIKIYLKPFYDDQTINQEKHLRRNVQQSQEKEDEVSSTLKRVPTLILFHDSGSESSSEENNDLNHMEHPEMLLVGSQQSLKVVARDQKEEEESSFDFNRISSPISDIFRRTDSPFTKIESNSFSENHKTLNAAEQAHIDDVKSSQKIVQVKQPAQDMPKQIKTKEKEIQVKQLELEKEKYLSVSDSSLKIEQLNKSAKKDESSSNNLNSSTLSKEQKISLLKKCVFKSKSLLIKDLSKVITRIDSQKAQVLISMLSSGYMAHRHINIVSCLSNNLLVSYCLAHPQITPKLRILYVLHLEVVHQSFKSVQVEMTNQFINFLFSSDPCHYIAILRMKQFSFEDIQYYKNSSFFVKEINTPAYLTDFNVKALLLERKGLKCQQKEEYVNVFNSILIAVLPVKENVSFISKFPSDLEVKISDRLKAQMNKQLSSSLCTNFMNWTLVAKHLKDQSFPNLQQIQKEGPFRMSMFSFEDCMLKTKFSVHSKQFYFNIDPPVSIIFQTKIAYFLILSTSNSKRYCVLGDKLYEQDEGVNVLQQFQQNLQGESYSDILTKSKKESNGKIITCPEFRKTIKSRSQQVSVTLNTELVWKQYIKGVLKPSEEDVYLQLVTPFFWGIAQLSQDNKFHLLLSANIQESELIK